jgi:hypothetical protein
VTAPTVLGILTRIYEAFAKGLDKVLDVAEVLIVSCSLPSQQGVNAVVKVIIPLRIETVSSEIHMPNETGVLKVALRNEIDSSVQPLCFVVHCHGEFLQKRLGGSIHDTVDGVDSESIDVELGYPRKSVFDEIATYFIAVRPIKVEGWPPRDMVLLGKIRAEVSEVIPFGAEVIIDDIQNNRDSLPVAGVNEPFEACGSTVGTVDGERIHTIIAPVAITRKLSDGHDFNCRDSQLEQFIEISDDGIKMAFRREGPDVKFIDNVVLQW